MTVPSRGSLRFLAVGLSCLIPLTTKIVRHKRAGFVRH